MNGLLAFLAGALIVAGAVLAIRSIRPTAERPTRTRPPGRRWRMPSRRTRITLAVGAAGGVAAALLSGVTILIVVVPAAAIVLPALIGRPNQRERDLLTALESWARSLAAASATGRLTLRDTIDVTRTAAPPLLRPHVDRLAARLAGGWTAPDALRAFADDLGDGWGDEVVIYLIQAAEYSAAGLAQALDGIATLLAQQRKLRADVFTERERPRRVMIQITWIVGAVIGLVVLAARTPQLAAFTTPLGQILLVVVLAVLVGLLAWARWIGRPRPDARFLIGRTTS